MLKRFDSAVIAAKPDLVLWQLGTNSVIRDHPLTDHGASIRDGIEKIKRAGRRHRADRSAIRAESDRQAGSRRAWSS